ncbi:HpcH/HpaI aldolase/citrate lyase family protein [Micromonospora cremea]|uniref:Citrate lyase subunit beta / citryl-CoA lyase n=1 Tax=Micromonospora cremea TaxID=709881 RepID=A0A1N5TEW4_9ACTN|nr:CoA ester lyase [Micromonospora cremea]SIM46696.1 citrate lyase subunit beta / citryl-CoA lyase [Micromonospora cremea]
MADPALPRTHLYVPGDRPDRFDKAVAAGADVVILDLEDAVAPDGKQPALEAVTGWLASRPTAAGPQLWVRVNRGALDEVEVLARRAALDGLCLPKVESAAEVEAVHALAPNVRLAPLVESAVGVARLSGIASAAGVVWLHLGELDLAADLGMTVSTGDELDAVRTMVVVASRAAGLAAPPAPVSPEVADMDRFAASTLRLRNLGFAGRACIHPRQVEVVHRLAAARAGDVAWARRVLVEACTHDGAAFVFEGSMIDEAVLRRARDIVAGDAGA